MTRRVVPCAFAAALLVAIAREAGGSLQGAEVGRPPHRMHHAVAYDPAAGRVMLFGGSHVPGSGAGVILDDLWGWDGRTWTIIAASTGRRISGHQLFADGAGRLFMTGGSTGVTARWDGKSWLTVAEHADQLLAGAAGAFDLRRKRFVLFGGSSSPGAVTGDTWEFDGQRWTRVATSGPPPLQAAAMAYDERRRVMVLFGGRDSARQVLGETWTWNGVRWERRAAGGPVPREQAGMAYDSRRGDVVLFGGSDAAFERLDDTWLWNGRAWRRADVDGPPPRTEPLMAFDASRSVAVLFGGAGELMPTLGDTWEWNGERWRRADPPSLATRPAPRSGEFAATIERLGIRAAMSRFHEARAADPDAALFRDHTIRQLARQLSSARPADALELLEAGVELHPRSAQIRLDLSEAYEATGDRMAAVDAARKTLDVLKANPIHRRKQQLIEQAASDRIRRLAS